MWRDSRDRNGGISPPPTRLRDFPNAHNCSRVKMEFDSNSSDIRLSTLNPIFSLPPLLLLPAHRVFNKGLPNWIEWNWRPKGVLDLPSQ